MFWRVLVISAVLAVAGVRGENKIFLGAVFDSDPKDQVAFRLAVDNANEFTRVSIPPVRPVVASIRPGDSFKAMRSVCNLLEADMLGIFGPKDLDNINAVQAVCDAKGIPHMVTRWTYELLMPMARNSVINFYPYGPTLTEAYFDIIKSLSWKTFTVLYDNNESITRVAGLIQMAKDDKLIVAVKKLDLYHNGTYRYALKDARYSGENNFVVDCRIEILKEVFLQAQQVGLITHEFHFFVTNLDLQTVDMSQFQYSEVNITGIRILDPESDLLKVTVAQLYSVDRSFFTDPQVPLAMQLKSETALLMDAVEMFTRALEKLNTTVNNRSISEKVRCDSSASLKFGDSLANYLKNKVTYAGLTGLIKFEKSGVRSNFELDILELYENDGFTKIGEWSPRKITATHRGDESVEDDVLRNRTLIVEICLTDPYAMLKLITTPLFGNDRFEGFGIDLIDELSVMEGFNYTFVVREDKNNGEKDNATGKWTGMIGDLIDNKADLAISDLTITADRATAVDFTAPFMSLGIGILFQKPTSAPPSFFTFADPFAVDTWCGLTLAFIFTSVSLFVMGRLCPDEWTNPYPCIEEPEYLVSQLSLRNSIWFVIGSLMQQGTEIAPIGFSTRMVAGMWWFFVLIMVASYTANLAAFLTSEPELNLFTDVSSLVANAEKFDIRYGAKGTGSTKVFFRDSTDPLYKKIHAHMEAHPEDLVTGNQEGVALAESTRYAFFMETTSIEYEIQRHCDLKQYGDRLDDKFYGIAMRKGAPYRDKLHLAILKLQSKGVLDKLKRKWWEEKRGGGMCRGAEEAPAATPLDLKNVEGVFYVTAVGVVCSVICVVFEMLLSTIRASVEKKIPFMEAFKTDLRYNLRFRCSVKPAIASKLKSKSRSLSESSRETKFCHIELKPEPYGFIMNDSRDS